LCYFTRISYIHGITTTKAISKNDLPSGSPGMTPLNLGT
jgi:hypothetical protein